MALLPDEVLDVLPSLGMEGKLNAGDAHLSVSYEKVINVGLIGYENRARDYKLNLDLAPFTNSLCATLNSRLKKLIRNVKPNSKKSAVPAKSRLNPTGAYVRFDHFRSQSHTLSSAGSPMYQNVTVGGQTVDKKDAVIHRPLPCQYR